VGYTRRFLIWILAVLLLVACTRQVYRLRNMDARGVEFTTELSKGYLEFSRQESFDLDWGDAQRFATKGIRARQGEYVEPEHLDMWSLPAHVVPMMAQARMHLVELLTPEVVYKYPKEAARVQIAFDCWVEEQEENWQTARIAGCREHFYQKLDALYTKSTSTDVLRNLFASPMPTAVIYFDVGKTTLTTRTKEIIKHMAGQLAHVKSYDIILNAYADSTGSKELNKQLSQQRAQSVKTELIKHGVLEDRIAVFAFGEEHPRFPSTDGKHVDENRSVEINIDIIR